MVSVCVAMLAAAALFNAAVDPHDTVGWVDVPGWTDRKIPDPPYGGRAALSLQLGNESYRGLLLGTSRERFGFAQEDPRLAERGIKNAALAGPNFTETAAVLDYALENQNLEIILLGLDFVAFREGEAFGGDFDASAFAGRAPWAVQLGRLVSGPTLEDSATTVYSSLTDRVPGGSEAAAFFEQSQAPAWNRFATSLLSYAGKHYACFEYDPERTAELRRVLDRTTQAGVETILFFPPVHATQVEAIRAAGLLPPYLKWRRDVVDTVREVRATLPGGERDLVRLWDFTGSSPYTTEPVWKRRPSKWYFESSHFRPELGALVLERLFGAPGADSAERLGDEIDPAGYPLHARRLQAEARAWARDHPNDAKLVRRTFRATRDLRIADCGEPPSS